MKFCIIIHPLELKITSDGLYFFYKSELGQFWIEYYRKNNSNIKYGNILHFNTYYFKKDIP